MPRKAVKTSLALAKTLRSRRQELGYTLREVVHRTREQGRPIPFSTLAKIEQGRVEPGIRRLHMLLRLYHLPIQMAGDVLDLEEAAGDLPEISTPEELYREGVEAWKRGDTRKGLANFLALRGIVTDDVEGNLLRQKSMLAFAIAGASMGKYRMALKTIEGLLLEPLDKSLRVSAYVQAAAIWDGLGCPDVALGFLSRAEAHVASDDDRQRAWVLHKKAGALASEGELDAAWRSLDSATEAYRQTGDLYGEGKLYGMRVTLHRAAGNLSAALEAAREGLEHADRHGYERLATLRRLQEGNLLVELSQEQAGLAVLHEALAAALPADDRGAQFYAHYYLWKAHDRLGDRDRARIERNAAEYFVQFVDDATEETLEIREGGREG